MSVIAVDLFCSFIQIDMITDEQKQWINHLSETDTIRIVPYDGNAPEIFESVAQKVAEKIGPCYSVEHHGATSLGISGQDEIDVYIPVLEKAFDNLVLKMQQAFGEPRSYYPGKRARFAFFEGKKRVDVFPINRESDDWKNLVFFETHLKKNPEALDRYRTLKESGNGLSVREYYKRKIEFINDILK